jgi:hypothetical protein
MKPIKKNEFQYLSFPDTQLIDFHLDFSSRNLAVKCADGYLDLPDAPKELEDVVLELKSFQDLTIKEFCEDKLTLVEKYSSAYALKDMCEFMVDQDLATLKGFSAVRGQWTEYWFTGGELQGYHKC